MYTDVIGPAAPVFGTGPISIATPSLSRCRTTASSGSPLIRQKSPVGDVLLAVEIWSGGSLLVVIYGRWENPGAEAPRKEPP